MFRFIPLTLSLLIALPALADIDDGFSKRMSLLPGDGYCVGIIKVVNLVGVYNETEHLEIDEGTVSVEYETVGGHNPTDDDLVRVVALPEGVLARPMDMALPDGDTGHICLLRWIGG